MSRRTPITTVRRTAIVACLLSLGARGASAQQADTADTPPRLRNAEDLVEELTENYPLRLRQDAIGGAARVRFRVNEKGEVDSAWIAYSSGLFGLDAAAMATARGAEFEPARRSGQPVPLWTELPFTFRTGFERSPDPQEIAVLNRAEVEAGLSAMRPQGLVDARIGASVGLSLLVDSAGRVDRATVVESSCFTEADTTAIAIARRLTFEPDASGIGARRRTYVSVHFGRDSVDLGLLGDANPPRTDSTRSSPIFDKDAPMAKPPRLANRPHIARLLESYYPPDLRELGVGGEALVWLHIDEEGVVTYKWVQRSSGECKLDAAALLVSDRMRFEPATTGGEPAAVYVAIPIVFSSK